MPRLAGLTEWENSSVVAARITQWATPSARQRCADANASKARHDAGHGRAGPGGVDIGRADGDIDRGIAAVEMALHGVSTTVPSTPFFRAPYFEMTPQTLDNLKKRGFVVFGADLWASDWNKMSPQQELKLLTERLNAAKKGIILLHDPTAQTAAMLPAFLRYLRENHYRVVHVVPASPAKAVDSAGKSEIGEKVQ